MSCQHRISAWTSKGLVMSSLGTNITTPNIAKMPTRVIKTGLSVANQKPNLLPSAIIIIILLQLVRCMGISKVPFSVYLAQTTKPSRMQLPIRAVIVCSRGQLNKLQLQYQPDELLRLSHIQELVMETDTKAEFICLIPVCATVQQIQTCLQK